MRRGDMSLVTILVIGTLTVLGIFLVYISLKNGIFASLDCLFGGC